MRAAAASGTTTLSGLSEIGRLDTQGRPASAEAAAARQPWAARRNPFGVLLAGLIARFGHVGTGRNQSGAFHECVSEWNFGNEGNAGESAYAHERGVLAFQSKIQSAVGGPKSKTLCPAPPLVVYAHGPAATPPRVPVVVRPAYAPGRSPLAFQSKIQNPKSKILHTLALLAACAAAPCGIVHADSLHDRIQQANGLLRSGEVDKALDSYHEIQVDHPDAPVLDYNIGCAEYDKGVKTLESGEKKDNGAPLSEAIASFDRAIQSGDPAVAGNAAFNRANCLAQTAKSAGAGADPAGRTKAFYDAIRAYEDVVKADPENAGAKQNIDHLRYMMKKASPPPPPQPGGESSKPQEDQGGQDQDQQQQPQDGQSDQQNQQQQSEQQQDQQQRDQQQQDKDPSAQQDEQQSQQEQSNVSPDDRQDTGAPEQQPEQQEQTGGAPDRQTVEALLQSLENQDNEMQKELRQGARTARVRPSAWW